ncbi:MAG: twin-arginine translocation signal domain-containing protein [Planctomycetota bacterium]
MKGNDIVCRCSSCGISRRQFLTGCAACVGTAGLLAQPMPLAAANKDKMRIHVVYSLHAVKQPRPDWPNIGFDFGPVMKRINTNLVKECPEFEFVSSMATGPEQAEKILEKDETGSVDGYIVYQMNCWNRVVQTLATSGKPVLYVDFQYGGSGGFLVYAAGFLRSEAGNVGFVASSNMEDIIASVKCFSAVGRGGSASDFAAATKRVRMKRTRKMGDMQCKADKLPAVSTDECVRRMKESKILSVRDQKSGAAGEMLGIPTESVSFAEVNAAWESADKDTAKAVARRWKADASDVIGVSDKTLETSAAMYLGMKDVLKKHGANAIAVNCLGGFYGGHIHAYPCLGFHQLNNEGLVGACECDIRSTATMLMIGAMTGGRPSFISDPVIDTAKRQIIYAHCVAPNRMFGPDGSANPFTIMTHSEDRQGASVRSILPLGYMTTTLEIRQPQKQILMHLGKAVDNDPDDRACRTKLAAEPVGDIEKLFGMWDQWGWHRVTCYGDIKEPVYALADAIGWDVIEEA